MKDVFARKSPSMREIFMGKRPLLRDFIENMLYTAFYCQAKSMLIV